MKTLIRLLRRLRVRVFFDSNVFLKYLAGVEEAKKLIDKVEYSEWRGYVNDVVISEVVYGYPRLALNVSRYKFKRIRNQVHR